METHFLIPSILNHDAVAIVSMSGLANGSCHEPGGLDDIIFCHEQSKQLEFAAPWRSLRERTGSAGCRFTSLDEAGYTWYIPTAGHFGQEFLSATEFFSWAAY